MDWEELLQDDVYGVILAEVNDDVKIFKPLHARKDNIIYTVEDLLKKHPDCRIRLFMVDIDPRNFPGVSKDNIY